MKTKLKLTFKSKQFELLKTFILALATCFMCIEILVYQKASSCGVQKGLSFCSDILIPSLFPFMVMSSFIIKSGLSEKLGYLFNPVVKFLFNLPGVAGATIIISLIGGYPAGVKGVMELWECNKLSLSQAQRMLCFTVGSGPSFVIGVIGIGIFKSYAVGLLMFICQILASILIGISLGIFSRIKKSHYEANIKNTNTSLPFSDAFVKSCIASTGQIINLCAFVVLFSALIEILKANSFENHFANALMYINVPYSYAHSLLFSILEVTGGCLNSGKLGASAEFIAFFIAFAGVCVHFQLFATLSKMNFSKVMFISFRIVHGLLSAVITHFALSIFPLSQETFCFHGSNIDGHLYSNIPAAVSLVALCIFFLISCAFCNKKDNSFNTNCPLISNIFNAIKNHKEMKNTSC